MNMGIRLASAPLSSSIPTIISSSSSTHSHTRQLNHHHHHLFSTFASPHFPFSLLSRESANLNPRRPLLSFTRYTPCKVSRGQVEVEDGVNDEACELVNGIELSIGEGAESIGAYLFKAVKNNNGTGILLLSDIFGFEDSSTRDFAYRVACNGYNVLVPDLFRGDPWEKDRPKPLFEEWLAKQTLQRVSNDITKCTKWMTDEFVAAGISKKLGIIGFCFGGGRVIDVLAHDQGVCFGIGVSFYGTRIDPSVAASVTVPVLFIAGDNDPLCPVSALEEIEKSSKKGLSKVLVFKGQGHGFAHRPQSPEEDGDAEKAFMVMRNWLYDGLVLGK
ncbi:Carboxymethylenebutenolidase [Actinidia chinensis var. chinensis]|uniref:Carboxymethylenebutenolidase homolog n=1 Tax=Actinidia chinensis var. chinensis TaxID=1590841 RepID=A0A2R6R2C7_ACTCC|nr:Carboxymethylenebutenolidase [Actinidia chinensis var. chinensis]